jgi:DNA modification methylase
MVIKPVYQSDLATIYNADALDVLPVIDRVDLLCTDPPYGVSFRSNFRVATERFDSIANDGAADRDIVAEVMKLAVSKLRTHRHVYSFGPADVIEHIQSLGKVTTLVWDKMMLGPGDLSSPWGPSWEPIAFAMKVGGKSDKARGTGNLSARLRGGSVLRHQRLNGGQVNRHPTEKPLGLMRQLIEASSCIGDTVLDCFMGSGSTCVAAILEGRRTIGIELDPGYAAIAVERVKRAEAIAQQLAAA